MKIAFFWTWEFSSNILCWILTYKNINVSLVVSQPDKPIWRKKEILPTPIKILALYNKINVLQPIKLRKNLDFFEELKNLNLDFIVVVAYWKIIPKVVLDIPKYWCINIHWSILPLYRGASPIQESIKNWDTYTWLTIMYMSEWMDEWDILNIKEIRIEKTDKTSDIFEKFVKIWPKLLIETLNWIIQWKNKWIKQDDNKASYCSKISKKDWEINFNKETASEIYNKFKAYSPWPWIYTYYNWKKLDIDNCCFSNIWDFEKNYTWDIKPWKVIKINKKTIWIICCDLKFLILTKVKLEWKKIMDINSFINWNKDFINYIF